MDLTEELTKLKSLLDMGVITQEEFDAKKAQLLSMPVTSYQQQPYQQAAYQQQPYQQVPAAADTGSAGWAVLGFFFPIVGLILYLVWNTTRPRDAKQAGKGALIGVIVEVALGLLYAIFVGVLVGSYY